MDGDRHMLSNLGLQNPLRDTPEDFLWNHNSKLFYKVLTDRNYSMISPTSHL